MKLTNVKLRNESIYCIFTRNFSEEGTFKTVIDKLQYIKDLGFTTIYLMPIHPIGELNKKGTLGSPYSIKDYYSINQELGTEDDFKDLISKTHDLDMKIIIDVVFHHTSWDSILIKEHEDWFYHKENGKIGNKVGDWSDIADLDFNNRYLWDYLLNSLKKWVSLGVDGFRCDVAPLIPMEFWSYLIKNLDKVKKNLIWLSESVEPSFIIYLRDNGHIAHSDSEVFNEFDISYDYDIKKEYREFLNDEISLKEFIAAINRQEYIYPNNYVKLRFLENHDNPRARELIKDERRRYNILAFMYFLKGAFLFYNGQETLEEKTIDLFNKDSINWRMDNKVIDLVKKLNKLKKLDFLAYGKFSMSELTDNTVEVRYEYNSKLVIGFFNIGKTEEKIDLDSEISTKNIIEFNEVFVTPIIIEVDI